MRSFSVCDAEKIAILSYPNLVLFLKDTDVDSNKSGYPKVRFVDALGKESYRNSMSVCCRLSDLKMLLNFKL